MKITKGISSLTLAGLGMLVLTQTAHAQLGASLYVAQTGHVIARFEGSDAGYDSTLFLDQVGIGPIFPNHSTPVGTTYDLGEFTAGTELIFRLHVLNTGDDFYTGPSTRNGDGLAHANVVDNWSEPDRTLVGFEDIFGGGDRDYNDHLFSFTNTAVPEPASFVAMAVGAVGILARRRRKN